MAGYHGTVRLGGAMYGRVVPSVGNEHRGYLGELLMPLQFCSRSAASRCSSRAEDGLNRLTTEQLLLH